MSSLYRSGTHARSFNKKSIGIEVLGDYDTEDPLRGRGLKCWTMASKAVAIILTRKGLPANSLTIKFHRDDPKTNKTCPGTKVTKSWFVEMVKAEMDVGKTDKSLSNTARIERIEKHLNIT